MEMHMLGRLITYGFWTVGRREYARWVVYKSKQNIVNKWWFF